MYNVEYELCAGLMSRENAAQLSSRHFSYILSQVLDYYDNLIFVCHYYDLYDIKHDFSSHCYSLLQI